MNKISELNSKWFWRLLKVFWIFILLIVLIASSIGIFYNFSHYNPEKLKNAKSFIIKNGFINNTINYTNKFYKDTTISDDKKKMLSEAIDKGLPNKDAEEYIGKTFYELEKNTISNIDNLINGNSNWESFSDFDSKYNIDIYETIGSSNDYRSINDYLKIIGSILGVLLGIVIFNFILTRIIYYIVLGKINPEK